MVNRDIQHACHDLNIYLIIGFQAVFVFLLQICHPQSYPLVQLLHLFLGFSLQSIVPASVCLYFFRMCDDK